MSCLQHKGDGYGMKGSSRARARIDKVEGAGEGRPRKNGVGDGYSSRLMVLERSQSFSSSSRKGSRRM